MDRVGQDALAGNTTGLNNVALGASAGASVTTESNNIFLGASVTGVGGESNAMYIGRVGTQTKAVIAGVRGTSVADGEMVVVDADGRLGSAPVPVGGGGDITGVAANTGLTGGGLSGDVVLALDTAYTDARYASIAHGHDVSVIAGAATVAANVFAGTQTINTGNLDLDSSTATVGNVTKNGTRFLHDFGAENVFLGTGAGNFTTTGDRNTGVGASALSSNTTGVANTAVGRMALNANASGVANTAIGQYTLGGNVSGDENTALGNHSLMWNETGDLNTGTGNNALRSNTSGGANTATGAGALQSNVSGNSNTAVGVFALGGTTGGFNVAVGSGAGINATSGFNNIYLGATVGGVAGESNTMYLRGGNQTRAFMGGVRVITTGVNNAIPVVIDSNGQLGTISSSARYREDIHDLGAASRRLFDLRPETFRYTQAFTGGVKPVQFGLIAEEVAQVFPELAVINADGQPETVKYQDLSVLLLNEVQRQQETIDRQARELDEERRRVDALERRMERLLEKLRN